MNIMSQSQYFRIGAGSIIYNDAGEIALFARNGEAHIWQFQQGGMDEGEEIEDTLWRELLEETGLTRDDVALVTPYPTWLSYTYPEDLRMTLRDQNCRGQIHRWYFLKLKPGVLIDLEKAADKEFVDVRFSSFAEFLTAGDRLKHEVYTELSRFFTKEIQK
jgi:putative (di)nucleoside polyphosphate hydrolase